MDRRAFINTIAAGVAAASGLQPRRTQARSPDKGSRPNILLMITDQQSWRMMSCTGNRWLRTPAMDALAAAGVRFERAYATNPVCGGSRFSLETGRMPAAVGISNEWNAPDGRVPPSVFDTSLGSLFRKAGYDTVYGGKIDLPRSYRDQFAGLAYRYFEQDERDQLAQACAAFIKGHHDRPFFLTASLISPHDICFVAINAYRASRGEAGIFDTVDASGMLLERARELQHESGFFEEMCPPLPENHDIPEGEASAVTDKVLRPMPYYGAFRSWVRKHWTDEDWRLHRWIYHRLTEDADRRIGTILTALRQAGLERDTLVVFTSDHGEMDGAHRLEAKEVLYEEAVRVPFIISLPGTLPGGLVDTRHLVSTGLDLLPTLCEFACIKLPPAALDGLSLRPVALGQGVKEWRQFVVAESWGDRMVRSDRFKYCRYSTGERAEQLIDLEADPGEMTNLAELPTHTDELKRHRALLEKWQRRTWDD